MLKKRSLRGSSLSSREVVTGGRGHWCWRVASPTAPSGRKEGSEYGLGAGLRWRVQWEFSPPAAKGEVMERFEVAAVHQLGRCCGTVQRAPWGGWTVGACTCNSTALIGLSVWFSLPTEVRARRGPAVGRNDGWGFTVPGQRFQGGHRVLKGLGWRVSAEGPGGRSWKRRDEGSVDGRW